MEGSSLCLSQCRHVHDVGVADTDGEGGHLVLTNDVQLVHQGEETDAAARPVQAVLLRQVAELDYEGQESSRSVHRGPRLQTHHHHDDYGAHMCMYVRVCGDRRANDCPIPFQVNNDQK